MSLYASFLYLVVHHYTIRFLHTYARNHPVLNVFYYVQTLLVKTTKTVRRFFANRDNFFIGWEFSFQSIPYMKRCFEKNTLMLKKELNIVFGFFTKISFHADEHINFPSSI